jgi:hypothetical protein
MKTSGGSHGDLQAAEELLDARRYRAACDAFSRLVDGAGPRAAAHVGWGRALAGLRNPVEAAARFEAALGDDPANVEAFGGLRDLWSDLPDPETLFRRLQHRVEASGRPAAQAAWSEFL